MPEVLYEEVIEVDERVVLLQDGCQLPRKDSKRIVTGICALILNVVILIQILRHISWSVFIFCNFTGI